MEEDAIVLELSNGQEVEVREVWTITDDDSFSEIEIVDCETNHVLKSFRDSLPDIDDPDFNSGKFLDEVEKILEED